MTRYTLAVEVPLPYEDAVERTREALADQGFGVLTEIDLKQTHKTKLDVDVAPQVILGACRPTLAHQALSRDPSVAALLPCNVVVRAVDEDRSVVEAFDPDIMQQMAPELGDVATDARARLEAALHALG